jgi:hypothetical protein
MKLAYPYDTSYLKHRFKTMGSTHTRRGTNPPDPFIIFSFTRRVSIK